MSPPLPGDNTGMSRRPGKRVLIWGDVGGQFTSFKARLRSAVAVYGAFDLVCCLGDFFGPLALSLPSFTEGAEWLRRYLEEVLPDEWPVPSLVVLDRVVSSTQQTLETTTPPQLQDPISISAVLRYCYPGHGPVQLTPHISLLRGSGRCVLADSLVVAFCSGPPATGSSTVAGNLLRGFFDPDHDVVDLCLLTSWPATVATGLSEMQRTELEALVESAGTEDDDTAGRAAATAFTQLVYAARYYFAAGGPRMGYERPGFRCPGRDDFVSQFIAVAPMPSLRWNRAPPAHSIRAIEAQSEDSVSQPSVAIPTNGSTSHFAHAFTIVPWSQLQAGDAQLITDNPFRPLPGKLSISHQPSNVALGSAALFPLKHREASPSGGPAVDPEGGVTTSMAPHQAASFNSESPPAKRARRQSRWASITPNSSPISGSTIAAELSFSTAVTTSGIGSASMAAGNDSPPASLPPFLQDNLPTSSSLVTAPTLRPQLVAPKEDSSTPSPFHNNTRFAQPQSYGRNPSSPGSSPAVPDSALRVEEPFAPFSTPALRLTLPESRAAGSASPEGGDLRARVVYVSNVPYSATKAELCECLSRFGRIDDVRFPKGGLGRVPGGRAWVTFHRPEDAEAAYRATNVVLFQRILRVVYANIQDRRGTGRDSSVDRLQDSRSVASESSHHESRRESCGNSSVKSGAVSVRRPPLDVRPQADCWFCLRNPACEKNLIVAVKDQMYIVISRGGIVQQHLLILPGSHQPAVAVFPPTMLQELQTVMTDVRRFFEKQGFATVFFERYIPMRLTRIMHTQIHAVPIPRHLVAVCHSAFEDRCANDGLTLVEAKSPFLSSLRPELTDLLTSTHESSFLQRRGHSDKELVISQAYVWLDLPLTGEPSDQAQRRPIICVAPNSRQRMNVNFPREVLCQVLQCPGRVFWKACASSRSEEEDCAAHIRDEYAQFLELDKRQAAADDGGSHSRQTIPPESASSSRVPVPPHVVVLRPAAALPIRGADGIPSTADHQDTISAAAQGPTTSTFMSHSSAAAAAAASSPPSSASSISSPDTPERGASPTFSPGANFPSAFLMGAPGIPMPKQVAEYEAGVPQSRPQVLKLQTPTMFR